jgi:hypothetical protein
MGSSANVLGGVRVDVRADLSQLASDFAAAGSQAARAGAGVAAAFTAAFATGMKAATAAVAPVSAALGGMASSATNISGLNNAIASLTGSMLAAATAAQGFAGAALSATVGVSALGNAAGTAAVSVQALSNASQQGAQNVNAAGAASTSSSVGYIRLYAAIALVRRGLDELDKFRETEETLKNVAAATGISAERLAAFQGAISRAGGDGEAFGQVLGRLARAQEQAAEGNAKMVDDFRRLTITAKDPIDQFYQMADVVHNTSDRFVALGVAARVTGRSSQELVGILSQGADALRANAAASGEYAAALAKAIPDADRLTQTEVQLKQAVSEVAAQAFPAVIAILKGVAVTVASVTDIFKIFFSVVIDGSFTAVAALETFAKVSGDVIGGNLVKATADAVQGFDDVRIAAKHLADDVKADFGGTNDFINKILNPPTITATAGAGRPFPKPAQTGANRSGEIEDQSEANHAKALEAQERTRADTALAIQQGSDKAIIQSVENRYAREVLLAGEELSLAQERQRIFTDLSNQEVAAAAAALQKKAALQSRDGKNAAAEVARTQGEIQAVYDRGAEEQLKLAEDIAKAQAHLQDTIAAQNRETAQEASKAVAESFTKDLEILKKFTEQVRAVREEAAKYQGQDAGLAIEAQRLALARDYGLQVDKTGRDQVAYAEQVSTLEAQRGTAQVTGLRNAANIAEQGTPSLGISPDAKRAADLRAQADKLELENTNKLYDATTKIAEAQQQLTLQYQLGQNFLQAANAAPGALGQGIAAGVFGDKKGGEDVGTQIEKSLKNVGQQLFGNILTTVIKQLITTIVAQTGLQATFNAIFGTATTTNTAAVVAATAASVALTTAITANTLAVTANTFVPKPFGFAGGGRPEPGVAAIVGERGPEIFIPDSAGTVIPAGKFSIGGVDGPVMPALPPISASATSGSWSIANMSINAHGITDPRAFVDYVVRELPNRLKRTGPQFSPSSRANQGPSAAG